MYLTKKKTFISSTSERPFVDSLRVTLIPKLYLNKWDSPGAITVGSRDSCLFVESIVNRFLVVKKRIIARFLDSEFFENGCSETIIEDYVSISRSPFSNILFVRISLKSG